ncbi:hypothetical protein [Pseudomonas phage pPA-3099-2aT.2]|uniref:Uncharacterized protein n=1 Tax=Pseudomonas phage pPA-3099-2aT.2 TaxID=3003808 RepID=A0AAF0ATH1_9CAUD|nr:hypothetical protein QE325_gp120 [Pseudomonas phage pPA-3099-2aT.2]WBQ35261.1 hypothetical protein [Pseudomonas phage pPA-3099-2aT.2]
MLQKQCYSNGETPMKISQILKNQLESSYQPHSFMCACVMDDIGVRWDQRSVVLKFIEELLNPEGQDECFPTLHAKLRAELPKVYHKEEWDQEEWDFYISPSAYNMRVVWWKTVIEQLEERGE